VVRGRERRQAFSECVYVAVSFRVTADYHGDPTHTLDPTENIHNVCVCVCVCVISPKRILWNIPGSEAKMLRCAR